MTALRFLLLEDNPLDADVIELTLQDGGTDCEIQRVETRDDFVGALETSRFDLILADYSLPGFDGITALGIAQTLCPDTPVIFVSASMGEELVIEALKQGATDYVLKQRLGRLVSCVQRALREAAEKRKRQEAEARLRLLAANLPRGAAFIVDRDLRYVLAEGEALEQLGLTCENFVGKTVGEAFDSTNAARYEPYYRQALNGEPFAVEHYHYDRYYITHGIPLRDTRGEIEAVLAISYDITDRKLAETALEQSEARFRLMLASAKEYAIFTLEPDGAIVSWNPGAERMFGYSEAEILGRDCRSLYAPEENDRDRVGWELQTALSEGHAENECWHVCKDGSRLWGSGFVMPLRYETEEVQGFIKIMRDVTAQRQADERLRLLYDITTDLLAVEQPMTLMRNLFGKIAPELGLDSYCNYIVEEKDNRLVLHLKNYEGISPEEAERIEWVEFGEYLCGWVAEHRQQLVLDRPHVPTHPQAQNISSMGATAYVGQPLIVQGRLLGTIAFISCTRTNFTPEEINLLQLMSEQVAIALERANLLVSIQQHAEQLQRANQIKDEFLAVLSHELRSPLTPILGWTRLLQAGKLNESRQREALATIERNAKLQTQLIEDLLDISRIMQGKLSLKVAPVSLAFAISAAVETVQLAADTKNIDLALDLEPGVPFVSGDAARLQQVVWNLLSNAIKFTPNGGRVTVELRQVDRTAVIRVTDSGKGIDPVFLPYVFDYFRQEDATTTRKFGGLGLGLAIVRQIVEMHGGTVRAESLGENRGATFTVRLPLVQQVVPAASERSAKSENTAEPLSNLEILVVEDDFDTREFQAFLLEQNGARVTAVASGFEALQAIERSVPDLLVSDVGMADMDGYMLIREIRSRPPETGGRIPAIAVTAYARELDREKALETGFQRHITKPIESRELIDAIAELIRSPGDPSNN